MDAIPKTSALGRNKNRNKNTQRKAYKFSKNKQR